MARTAGPRRSSRGPVASGRAVGLLNPPTHPRIPGGWRPHTPTGKGKASHPQQPSMQAALGQRGVAQTPAVGSTPSPRGFPSGWRIGARWTPFRSSGAWGGAPQIRRAGGWASELHCPAPRPSDGDSRAAAFPCAEASLSSVSTSLYSEACHRKARPARCSPGPRVASAPRPCGAAGTAQRRPTRAARCRCPLRGDRARPSRSGAPAPAYRRCGRSRGRLRG